MDLATPTKRDLRARHTAARLERSEAELTGLAGDFCDRLLALPEMSRVRTVAAFLSQDGEPGTRPLIDALHGSGVTVILPILRDDFDLDWGRFEPGRQEPGRFGLLVPSTEPLGVDAVADADVVVCPGVAVDRLGNRLGRGGGSYDRALARCGPHVLRVQLAYDDELVDVVPTDPHDEPVDVVVTPTMVIRFGR